MEIFESWLYMFMSPRELPPLIEAENNWGFRLSSTDCLLTLYLMRSNISVGADDSSDTFPASSGKVGLYQQIICQVGTHGKFDLVMWGNLRQYRYLAFAGNPSNLYQRLGNKANPNAHLRKVFDVEHLLL